MSRYEGASTEKANIIGVDLAKPVFQVHGACRDGSVAFRKKISRQNCFRSYRLSRSVVRWRLAPAQMLGGGMFKRWATKCA